MIPMGCGYIENDTYSREKIRELKRRVRENMSRAMDALRKIQDPVKLFREMKFGEIGFSPMVSTEERENIMEQINQSFTILMSCYAAENYFTETPEATFKFAFASARGRDMVVYDRGGKTIAEVEIFTAVNAGNNRKLRRDVDRMRVAKIPSGVRRMVCYSARSECRMKNRPKNVTVKFCQLNDFIDWIKKQV